MSQALDTWTLLRFEAPWGRATVRRAQHVIAASPSILKYCGHNCGRTLDKVGSRFNDGVQTASKCLDLAMLVKRSTDFPHSAVRTASSRTAYPPRTSVG